MALMMFRTTFFAASSGVCIADLIPFQIELTVFLTPLNTFEMVVLIALTMLDTTLWALWMKLEIVE